MDIKGITEIFNDAPLTEGPVCVVVDPSMDNADGRHTMEGTHFLSSGDLLTIFSRAANRSVLWHGQLAFDHGTGKAIQRGFTEKGWYALFESRNPCLLVKNG